MDDDLLQRSPRAGSGRALAPRRVTNVARVEPLNQQISLKAVINSLRKAVCVFDAAHRLVACSDQYASLFRLPHGLIKPGETLAQIYRHHMESGFFRSGQANAFVTECLRLAAQNKSARTTLEMKNGRIFAMLHEPIAGGGWMATFEEIAGDARIRGETHQLQTAEAIAEDRGDETHRRLSAPVEADVRLAQWGQRYASLYQEIHGRPPRGWRNRAASDGEAQLGDDAVGRPERLPRPPHRNDEARVDIEDPAGSETPFRILFDRNPVPMWVFDKQSLRFIAVNAAALRHSGYTRGQFLGMTLDDVRAPDDADGRGLALNAADGGHLGGGRWRYLQADGAAADVVIHSQTLFYEGREAIVAAVIDATEDRRAETERLRASELLDTIIENLPSVLFVKEPREHRYVFVNRRCEQLLGIPREELLGRTDHELFAKGDADLAMARDRQVFQGERLQSRSNESIHTRHNGIREVAVQRLAIVGGDGTRKYLLGVAEDVTRRRRETEGVVAPAHRRALTDALTDLPNRPAFSRILALTFDWAKARDGAFATLRLDLSRFKEIGDRFGPSVAELLLKEVAKRLEGARAKSFLARLGEDEFALVTADGPQPETAVAIAGQLLRAMAADFDVDGHQLQVALSVGISRYPADGGDATTLFDNAGAALGRARAAGGGALRLFDANTDNRLH